MTAETIAQAIARRIQTQSVAFSMKKILESDIIVLRNQAAELATGFELARADVQSAIATGQAALASNIRDLWGDAPGTEFVARQILAKGADEREPAVRERHRAG